MAVKYSIQGLLIYLALAGYAAAMLAAICRRPKLASWLYRAGFIIVGIAIIYRWFHVRHVPMQNLFEVFLLMAVMIYPISVFSKRVLAVRTTAVDMLLGIVVLFPAGFVFSAEPQTLPPALQCWLFAPHVAAYMLAYMILAKAAVPAVVAFFTTRPAADAGANEQAAYQLVCLAYPLLTLGLILGSWWANLAWGDFWGWDPKELWSLATWLIYLGYFHFRYMFGRKYPRLNSAWVVAGLIAVIITLLWVNLSNIFAGLHSYAA
jgi:ABC-type transport system involved in cytochrome c biogenesis permease subunit